MDVRLCGCHTAVKDKFHELLKYLPLISLGESEDTSEADISPRFTLLSKILALLRRN